ncbi:MAG TPA: hypothetical protein VFR81_26605 [Longimicrobium sp.]|nr:hypothetical protein [Longimicrobium sp.]
MADAVVLDRRRAGLPRGLRVAAGVFDRLEHGWEGAAAQRRLSTALVASFLVSVAAIEANRLGLLPAPLDARLPTNHLAAIYVAFTLLLLLEVVGLVFALPRSVADSVGKQFELLSLILLRKAFLEIASFPEPVRWEDVAPAVPRVAADVGGALLIFVVLGFYYRSQRHLPISTVVDDRSSFIAVKKLLALGLLAVLALLGAIDGWRLVVEGREETFFTTFYTVLIFTDILVVLVSLRYSSEYRVVFRYSGFAAATVLIRLALTAPPYVNAALGFGAAVFALGLTLAYNAFAPVLGPSSTEDGDPE